jgi:hypothetical protein
MIPLLDIRKLKLCDTIHRMVHDKQLRQLSTSCGFAADEGTTGSYLHNGEDLRRVEGFDILSGYFGQRPLKEWK